MDRTQLPNQISFSFSLMLLLHVHQHTIFKQSQEMHYGSSCFYPIFTIPECGCAPASCSRSSPPPSPCGRPSSPPPPRSTSRTSLRPPSGTLGTPATARTQCSDPDTAPSHTTQTTTSRYKDTDGETKRENEIQLTSSFLVSGSKSRTVL